MRTNWKKPLRTVVLLSWLLAGVVSPLLAVTSEEQADRLQQIYGFLLDYRSNAAPLPEDPGTFDVQVDLLLMPSIDNRIGSKNEPVDTLPVVPRLRGRLHLPYGLVVGLAGSPGIPTGSQTATFLQGEVDWRHDADHLLYGLRASSSSWKVVGKITTKTYDDTFRIQERNVDVRLGWKTGEWIPYAGLGLGQQSTYLLIGEDSVSLSLVNQAYDYRFAGVERRGDHWDFSLEQHQTEDFLQHIQFAVRRRF